MLEEPYRLRSDGHGAHSLLVAGMAHVQDGVPLAAADLELVVDLGDQRADRVDDDATLGSRRLDHLGRRAMGAEHQGRTVGTSPTSSTKMTPWSRKRSTTCRLWTISW